MTLHLVHSTQQVTLDEYKQRIYDRVSSMALDIGGILVEAKKTHPEDFDRWVVEDLPFGLDTARRLMAIHVAYRELPKDVLEKLPRPWQALFALRHIPQDALEAKIAAGELGPGTTVKQAKRVARNWKPQKRKPAGRLHSQADIIAARLTSEPRDELSAEVEADLRTWLDTPRADDPV